MTRFLVALAKFCVGSNGSVVSVGGFVPDSAEILQEQTEKTEKESLSEPDLIKSLEELAESRGSLSMKILGGKEAIEVQ